MSALHAQLNEARGTRTQKLPRRHQQVPAAAHMAASQQPRRRSQSASAGTSKKRPTLTKTSANGIAGVVVMGVLIDGVVYTFSPSVTLIPVGSGLRGGGGGISNTNAASDIVYVYLSTSMLFRVYFACVTVVA